MRIPLKKLITLGHVWGVRKAAPRRFMTFRNLSLVCKVNEKQEYNYNETQDGTNWAPCCLFGLKSICHFGAGKVEKSLWGILNPAGKTVDPACLQAGLVLKNYWAGALSGLPARREFEPEVQI